MLHLLATVVGPFLPVGVRQLLGELQPVSRFVPRPSASKCRAVVIRTQGSAVHDPEQTSHQSESILGHM